jgi:serine-type D-Ala-D-Ala carboxypeptidase/endopeptidase (penicillin-binding protein 4)
MASHRSASWRQSSLGRLLVAACAVVLFAVLTTGAAANELWPYGVVPHTDAPPASAPASGALTKLQKTLSSDLNRQGGANSGLVIDETTDQTLWAYNDNVPRLPASVEKLWTTSTALLEWGPDAALRTRVLGVGELGSSGTFTGTVYLKGGGDPTFGSDEFDHAMYNGGATVQRLAAALRGAGVTRIDGRIVGDESYFDSERGGPDSHYGPDLETEGSLSALAFDDGFTDLEENKLDANPPLVAAQAFTSALRAAGISVPADTPVGTGVTPEQALPLTSVGSPRISTLIRLTNSPSDNFFAEMLLKGLGAQFGRRGTTSAGSSVVEDEMAAQMGLHPKLDDGSGLSRYDRSSVRQIVLLLREMQAQPGFSDSLAIAGVRGTMKREMRHTRGANNCRGKTGTLHDVANLVGYCRAANGDQIVFAFMMNRLTDSTAGHDLEDLDAEALADYRG